MSKNIEKLNNNLRNQFDIEEPNIGHFDRFQKKLTKIETKPKRKFNFKFLTIAASIILLLSIGFKNFNTNAGVELAEVSPKMEETQDYFTSVIHEELTKIKKAETIENKVIIEDAFIQITNLENNYKKLTVELKRNSNSKHIIFAMINNYQQRITVLQNLLDELDKFKQLKNSKNENNII